MLDPPTSPPRHSGPRPIACGRTLLQTGRLGRPLSHMGLTADEVLGDSLSLPGVNTAIIGCGSPAEVDENFAIACAFHPFAEEQMRRLEQRTARSAGRRRFDRHPAGHRGRARSAGVIATIRRLNARVFRTQAISHRSGHPSNRDRLSPTAQRQANRRGRMVDHARRSESSRALGTKPASSSKARSCGFILDPAHRQRGRARRESISIQSPEVRQVVLKFFDQHLRSQQ